MTFSDQLDKIQSNPRFEVQITAILHNFCSPIPLGGLFSFLEQKSASKALKTWYFAYFSSQWGARAPPAHATEHKIMPFCSF